MPIVKETIHRLIITLLQQQRVKRRKKANVNGVLKGGAVDFEIISQFRVDPFMQQVE